jgi:[acyl-carrier-protein] S-malonyltransferase
MSKTAILFPGQGAQAVGMGKDLAAAHPECRALYDRASAVLGYDLAAVCFDGPIEKLTISAHAQPAIFVTSLACLTALQLRVPGLRHDFLAGLSSGEWTALHLAGAIGFEETLRVLEARGRFMQEACSATPGAMMSVIGADAAALEKVCEQSGAEQANLNSREQVVLSGTKESIDAAERVARELGIRKLIRLNVAGAFHSALMRPAADRLQSVLDAVAFRPLSLPVVANVTARPHGAPDTVGATMVRQVYSSVNWVGSIEWLKGEGVTTYVECGPGKVLVGLVRRIDNAASLHNISDLPTLEAAAGKLNSGGN